MKKIIVTTLLLLSTMLSINDVNAQPPWVTTTDSMGMVSFDTPDIPVYYNQDSISAIDSGNIIPDYAVYGDSVDSFIYIQVHISDSSIIDTTDEVVDSILAAEGGDELRTIAQLVLLVTPNCSLTQLNSVSTPINGMDLGVTIERVPAQGDSPPIKEYVFIRYFLHNGKLYTFTTSGRQQDLTYIQTLKTQLYNSIVFH